MSNVIDLPAPQRVPRRPDGSINIEQLAREWEPSGAAFFAQGGGEYRRCSFHEYVAAIVERDVWATAAARDDYRSQLVAIALIDAHDTGYRKGAAAGPYDLDG